MTAARRVALGAVLSGTLGVGFLFGLQPPLIALVLARGGSSNFAIGAVTAASLISVILLGPFYPVAIARLGLKGGMLAGVACAALILLLMPAHVSVWYWYCLRLATGCALGLSWIASEVWLNRLSGPDSRGIVMGFYGMVFSIGVMAGPALLEFTGTQGWLPFVAGAVCLTLTLLPLVWLRDVVELPQAFTPLWQLRGALRRAPVVMLAAFVAGLVECAELTLLPLFGSQRGFDDHRALLLVTVFMSGNVVMQVPIGLGADRIGRRVMLCLCAVVGGIGPLLLLPALTTPWLLWPLLFAWGGTLYAFYSQGVALLGGVFPAAELPTANTLFVMCYCLGGIIGPNLGGIVMDVWPLHGLPALLSGAAVILLCGLIFGIRGR